MQRRSNNSSAFVTCQGPHYCQGMQPRAGGCGAPWQCTLTGPTLHTLPSPWLLGACGYWWCQIIPHGGPELLLGHQPWKEGKDLAASLCLEPPVSEWDVFSQRAESFLQSIQTEPPLMVRGGGLWDIPSKDVCQVHRERAPHIRSQSWRCKRPHGNPLIKPLTDMDQHCSKSSWVP